MKIENILAIIFFLCFISEKSFCQDQRFQVGLIAGINHSSYLHSTGLNTGAIGIAKLTENSQLGIEVLYSQKGKYNALTYVPPEYRFGSIWFNYVEVPVHFDWLIHAFRHEFRDLNLNVGMAYTRIVGTTYTEKDADIKLINERITFDDRNNLVIQAGVSYNFSKRIGLNFKTSYPLRKNDLLPTFATRLMYIFN